MKSLHERILDTITIWDESKTDAPDDPVYIKSNQEHEAEDIINLIKTDFEERFHVSDHPETKNTTYLVPEDYFDE